MQLKPIRRCSAKTLPKHITDIMNADGKFITETQLAEILGLTVQKAVNKAIVLGFSRIHVKNSRYYSKKQVKAYLDNL